MKFDLAMLYILAPQIPYFICDPVTAICTFFLHYGLLQLANSTNHVIADAGDSTPFDGAIWKFWIALSILALIVSQFEGDSKAKTTPVFNLRTFSMFYLFQFDSFFQVFDVLNLILDYREEDKEKLDKIV